MRYLFLIINLFWSVSCQDTPKPLNVGIKYLPFSTRTNIPITEQSLDEQKPSSLNFIRETIITNYNSINNIQKVFNSIIETPFVKITDYDLRVVVTILYNNDKKEKFYINWDRKHILYKGNFYYLNDSQKKLLLQNLNIPFY